jgi:DNA repair exonuclease SbcCD ATPase subunit
MSERGGIQGLDFKALDERVDRVLSRGPSVDPEPTQADAVVKDEGNDGHAGVVTLDDSNVKKGNGVASADIGGEIDVEDFKDATLPEIAAALVRLADNQKITSENLARIITKAVERVLVRLDKGNVSPEAFVHGADVLAQVQKLTELHGTLPQSVSMEMTKVARLVQIGISKEIDKKMRRIGRLIRTVRTPKGAKRIEKTLTKTYGDMHELLMRADRRSLEVAKILELQEAGITQLIREQQKLPSELKAQMGVLTSMLHQVAEGRVADRKWLDDQFALLAAAGAIADGTEKAEYQKMREYIAELETRNRALAAEREQALKDQYDETIATARERSRAEELEQRIREQDLDFGRVAAETGKTLSVVTAERDRVRGEFERAIASATKAEAAWDAAEKARIDAEERVRALEAQLAAVQRQREEAERAAEAREREKAEAMKAEAHLQVSETERRQQEEDARRKASQAREAEAREAAERRQQIEHTFKVKEAQRRETAINAALALKAQEAAARKVAQEEEARRAAEVERLEARQQVVLREAFSKLVKIPGAVGNRSRYASITDFLSSVDDVIGLINRNYGGDEKRNSREKVISTIHAWADEVRALQEKIGAHSVPSNELGSIAA